MIYLDTSVLVPYFLPEAESARVDAAISGASEPVSISHWTEAEFVSALAKKVRNRECSEAIMRRTIAQLRATVATSFVRFAPVVADFERAISMMQTPKAGLRAGDALQLAIAERNSATIWTLDEGLIASARVLRLPVHKP